VFSTSVNSLGDERHRSGGGIIAGGGKRCHKYRTPMGVKGQRQSYGLMAAKTLAFPLMNQFSTPSSRHLGQRIPGTFLRGQQHCSVIMRSHKSCDCGSSCFRHLDSRRLYAESSHGATHTGTRFRLRLDVRFAVTDLTIAVLAFIVPALFTGGSGSPASFTRGFALRARSVGRVGVILG
jgi:hypothetical protein